MDTQLDYILKQGKILNELELERALVIDRKLRLLLKEHPELSQKRKELRTIIKNYEDFKWNSKSEISEAQIKESDAAEYNAEQERRFIEKRKKAIKTQLLKHKLTQEKLGKILGHSKSYTSELVNGINPFSLKDLVIIHRLFHIKLEVLIPTILSQNDMKKIQSSIRKLNRNELKLGKHNMELA